ncbi:hypothetical protein P9027_22735 [Bacillus thuringiensis]|uniref:hypothetical protein n=1 Tax=Bacillus cereus group TaxID=86661 RepID=UPI0029C12FC2|nr:MULTISPECIES: hypothetical protein [Bacillus cereus group]MDX5747208.1 hypothetical protein [Bacillus cereus group sp. BfR-BA-02570]MDX5769675.1 hypothetical protein [Bacillus cereus group sp. BfR-BA-02675]MEC3224805.1 hypothetical protein [Bacillus thuringiensis]MEC3461700.1 hypothetical protein [Bacillus thuringiensis]MEC3554964.1 hypothetical protein [Bacillus thuringiensis]
MNHVIDKSVTQLTSKMNRTFEEMETYDSFKFASDSLRKEYENPKSSFLRVLNRFVLRIEKKVLDYLLKRKVDERIVVEQMVDDFSNYDLEQQLQIIESIDEYEEECMEFGEYMQPEIEDYEIEPYKACI